MLSTRYQSDKPERHHLRGWAPKNGRYCNLRINSPPDALLHLEWRICTVFAEFALLDLGHKKQSNCERSDALSSGGVNHQDKNKTKKEKTSRS